MDDKFVNMAIFSMHANDVKDLAFMAYGLPLITEDNCEMRCVLEYLWFGKSASRQFKKVFCEEVPVMVTYRKGLIPLEFQHWSNARCVIKDISKFDVSFDKFWNTYGHKIGNKGGVMKKWEKLSWEDRIMAIGNIPKMRRFYEKSRLEIPYPETYINQRRWENEYEG